MQKLDLVGINNGLAQGFAFDKQADGSYVHDRAYPAAYACNGYTGDIKMLIFHEGVVLKEVSISISPDIDSGPIVFYPAIGVIIHCDVVLEYDEDDNDEGPYKRALIVDKLEFVYTG